MLFFSLTIVSVFAIFNLGESWKFSAATRPFLAKVVKPVAAGLLVFSLADPSLAIPALDAATRAMMETKEKTVVEKDFKDLSDAGKKRKALGYCKDGDARQAAGYRSASDCTAAVLSGNYGITFSAENFKSSKIMQSASPSSSAANPSKSYAAVETVFDTSKLEKQFDLSALPLAAQKRRAVAACKKQDVRKYAKFSSQGKCTDTVLQGDFAKVIEALEYGL